MNNILGLKPSRYLDSGGPLWPGKPAFGGKVTMGIEIENNWSDRVFLIEPREEYSSDELITAFPGRPICCCGFRIAWGESRSYSTPEGVILSEDLASVDNHRGLDTYPSQEITSTTIAIDYVRKHGLGCEYVCIVNRVDADSVLSALIMSGVLKPSDEWVRASLAAEHTGEANPVADLLQSLEPDRDLDRSIDALVKVTQRLKSRDRLRQYVKKGRFRRKGDVAYVVLGEGEQLDSALLPSVAFEDADLSSAWVFLAASPVLGKSGFWRIWLRLGRAAEISDDDYNNFKIPPTSLHMFDLSGSFDVTWQAADGETNIEPEEFVRCLDERLIEWRRNHRIRLAG
jgi:hypothetical protein